MGSFHAPTPAPPPLLIDAVEAARLLDVSRAHLYALLSSGRLPAPIHLGRAARWDREDVIRWARAGAPSAERWQAMREAQRRR
jgi:excisionase family DNA binding protein